jgi:hypothetical protein
VPESKKRTCRFWHNLSRVIAAEKRNGLDWLSEPFLRLLPLRKFFRAARKYLTHLAKVVCLQDKFGSSFLFSMRTQTSREQADYLFKFYIIATKEAVFLLAVLNLL